MQTYAPAKVSRLLSRLSGNDPAPGPAEVADTSQVELTHMTITGVLVYPGDAVTEHPCVGQNRCTLPVGGRVWVSFDTAGFEGFAGPGADLLTPNVAGPSTWSFNTNGRSLVRIEAVYPVPEPDPVPEPVLDEVIALLEAIQAQIDVLETVVQQIQEAQRRAARAVLGEE
jgi:hypothetical protein